MAERKVSRTDQAIAVRDAALSLLRAVGQNEPNKDGNTYRVWRSASLGMVLRTPFQRMPPISGEDIRRAAIYGVRLPKQLGYGLDIWEQPGGKKFNIEWDGQGTVELRGFRRGAWEAEIIRLASCLPALRTGTA
jgi:hypothetical protein